jgi:hypothetical protein
MIKRVFGADLEKRISSLESLVGKEEAKEKKQRSYLGVHWDYWLFDPSSHRTLVSESKSIREDFEELNKKFDALERYLQVEYYKEDKETQVYDWADKKHSEGFRKTKKTYEQMKKEKESKETSYKSDGVWIDDF